MTKLQVLLVAAAPAEQHNLHRLLEADDEAQVVATSSEPREATLLAVRFRVQAIVLSGPLPPLSTAEAAREVRAHVVVFSTAPSAVELRACLRAGTRACLVRAAAASALGPALHAVRAGGIFLGHPLDGLLLEDRLSFTTRSDLEGVARLTGRERQVAQLIADGKTNKDIALCLGVTVNTAETHRKHLMEKLGLHNTAEIVRFALRSRLAN